MARETAYSLVHTLAMKSWDDKLDFRELLRQEPKVLDLIPLQELNPLFDYSYYVRHVDETFLRAGLLDKNNGQN